MDLQTFAYSISNISEISELLPCALYLAYLRNQKPFHLLGYYFILSAIIKLTTLLMADLGIENMFAFHLLALVEVVFLYRFYHQIIYEERAKLSVILLLICLATVNTLFVENLHQFNSLGWTFTVFFLLCMGLLYLSKLYKDLENIQLHRHPLFIVNAGLLIYFSGSLFTYLFATKILSQEAKGFFHNAWMIQCFSNISKNTIVGYGLWLARFK